MDKGQFLLYQTPDGNSQIEVKLQNDTVWLSLDQMAELFQRNKSTISRHIKNVLEDGELQEEATIANFATVQNEGTRKVERVIAFYNLDMIISVGYRVHSYRGVQFSIMEMFISFFTGKVMLFYGISLIMKEKSNASALLSSQTQPNLGADALAAGSRDADKHRERKGEVL